MTTARVSILLTVSSLFLAGCALIPAEPGGGARIAGQILDTGSLLPVAGAEVVVVERGLRTWSAADGAYEFRGLPAGDWTVAAFASECRMASGHIAVTRGESRRLDMELEPQGRQTFRRQFMEASSVRASGASIREIRTEELERSPARTVAEHLLLRYPELFDAGTGSPGAAPRFRSRSSGLTGQRLEPMVLVDGVQVGAGGRTAARGMDALARMSTAEVHRVHILRGPAASAMHGTGAAAGVIHVLTRAGHRERGTEISMASC